MLCCGGCGLAVFFGNKMTDRARAEFSEAEGLWNKGDQAAGLAKYQTIIDGSLDNFLKDDERAKLYGRLIDNEYDNHRPAAGKALIDKATNKDIVPVVSHGDAKVVINGIQAEKKRVEAENAQRRRLAEAEKKAKELKASRKKSKYTRDEFRQLVMHQTKNDVLEYLGKPGDTQGVGDMDLWYYDGITYDPITSNTDIRVQLMFQHGRVQNVNFL